MTHVARYTLADLGNAALVIPLVDVREGITEIRLDS